MKTESMNLDKRLPPKQEAEIKAELMSRGLGVIIDNFHNPSSPPEEREKLLQRIFSRAKRIHDTLASSEP